MQVQLHGYVPPTDSNFLSREGVSGRNYYDPRTVTRRPSVDPKFASQCARRTKPPIPMDKYREGKWFDRRLLIGPTWSLSRSGPPEFAEPRFGGEGRRARALLAGASEPQGASQRVLRWGLGLVRVSPHFWSCMQMCVCVCLGFCVCGKERKKKGWFLAPSQARRDPRRCLIRIPSSPITGASIRPKRGCLGMNGREGERKKE